MEVLSKFMIPVADDTPSNQLCCFSETGRLNCVLLPKMSDIISRVCNLSLMLSQAEK